MENNSKLEGVFIATQYELENNKTLVISEVTYFEHGKTKEVKLDKVIPFLKGRDFVFNVPHRDEERMNVKTYLTIHSLTFDPSCELIRVGEITEHYFMGDSTGGPCKHKHVLKILPYSVVKIK